MANDIDRQQLLNILSQSLRKQQQISASTSQEEINKAVDEQPVDLSAVGGLISDLTGRQINIPKPVSQGEKKAQLLKQLQAELGAERQVFGAAGSILNTLSRESELKLKRQERAGKKAKITGNQREAAGFATRMSQAEKIFSTLDAKGFNRASFTSGFKAFLTPDALKSEDLKRQEQAERNFVNAVLRRESGAAISPAEFESAEKQYFPRAGDTPQNLRDKAATRRIVTQSLLNEAGGAGEKLLKQFRNEVQDIQPSETISVGSLQDGYRFLGGDPADQTNWERQ